MNDNKTHYSEADLLETYYTQPGESLPVMMHLADCSECASRYERIERKVRSLGACGHDEKPDTFWARQRISIMRRVNRQTHTSSIARVAAAAVLALVLGGVVVSNRDDVPTPVQKPAVLTATTAVSTESAIAKQSDDATDPWQSEELKEFGSMVEWESWVEPGDQSL